MKIQNHLIIAIGFCLSSCFAPSNLTFESARTLDKGAIEIQGNYSKYYFREHEDSDYININNNFGFKIGYGVSENYTIKLKYERMRLVHGYDNDVVFLGNLNNLNIIEVENKFKFKHANIAAGLPVSYYFLDKAGGLRFGFIMFDPRIYFTLFSSTNIFELNIIPKAHISINSGFFFWPAFSTGLGLSSNLKKWALRPEIGWDGYLSYGIALNINLGRLFNKE